MKTAVEKLRRRRAERKRERESGHCYTKGKQEELKARLEGGRGSCSYFRVELDKVGQQSLRAYWER